MTDGADGDLARIACLTGGRFHVVIPGKSLGEGLVTRMPERI